MAIKKLVLSSDKPSEDPNKKRIESLDEQIKQAQETLKQAKESDSKSERVFNLNQRVNNLKSQRDRLKRRAQKTDKPKETARLLTEDEVRARANKPCKMHGKVDCQSTMCPESPNFNVLTTI